MCGIVGYCGYQNAKNIVLDGLKLLEYRGYDSAGIALVKEQLYLFKTAGSVDALLTMLPDMSAHTAIGHTRWATHGSPDAVNAHPHLSFDRSIAVVHNGVIENCDVLKDELRRKGINFASQTDSEVIAHLLALEYDGDMAQAVEKVGKKLEGAATFLAVRRGDDSIYARRKGASLAVGIGEGECFVASDTLAISRYTRSTVIMDDGECAVITPGCAKFFVDGKPVQKRTLKIKRTPPKPCACHMRSEIDEIPKALERTFLSFEGFDDRRLYAASHIYLAGCGTAYHACLYGKYALERLLGIPCDAVPASEFDGALVKPDAYGVFITQSGETADTIEALLKMKAAGCPTLAVTNVDHSAITLIADRTLLLDAGPEVAVAATKTYNCQLLALYLLGRAGTQHPMTPQELSKLVSAANAMRESLYEDRFCNSDMFLVGKGADYITALEGALKFKEITYKMTDAYAAGELKHGAIALIDDKSAAVVIATSPPDKHRIEATVSELNSRGAYTVAISSVGDIGAARTLKLPQMDDPLLYPLLAILPLQTLALTSSVRLGLNPDKPRNLAKSVTVI